MTSKMKVAHRPANAAAAPEEFPVGLRVLVVDDDATCLRILDHMLQRCRYRVTTCCQAAVALSLLRERKGSYDVVISDVHMPDMDGFKLLEHVGLEMDLPVIMMSIDGGTDAVMKGIKHGACDYLIKPVRMEELKNIWQHVIRKKWNENKEVEHSGSLEDSDRHRRMVDDADYASSVNDGAEGTWISQKKKRAVKEDEDDDEMDSADPTASKRPRVVWTVELHQQFVSAVNQLGIEKAVPKRILELMNVPGLSRENIASHLQKFRLYLKRLSGVVQHHGALPNSFCGPLESNTKMGPFGRLDFQALAAAGQIPPQTLAALHAELLRRPSGGSVFSGTTDKPVLLQAPIQGLKCIPMEPGVAYGQPLLEPGFSMCSRGDSNVINVQPSCVVPSPSSSFQMGISPGPMNGNNLATSAPASSSFHVGINPLSSQSSDIPFGGAQVSESSISYSLSRVDSCTSWGVHNSGSNIGSPSRLAKNLPDLCILGSESKTGALATQGRGRYLGFVGKGTCIPSRFAVDDAESPTSDLSNRRACGDGDSVKQELHLDFTDSSRYGNSILPHFSANDPISLLSK